MKYRINHPSQDLARALGLEKKAEERIDNAIGAAFQGKVTSVDEAIGLVAPYLKTPEEAFYAAITITATAQTGAKWEHN